MNITKKKKKKNKQKRTSIIGGPLTSYTSQITCIKRKYMYVVWHMRHEEADKPMKSWTLGYLLSLKRRWCTGWFEPSVVTPAWRHVFAERHPKFLLLRTFVLLQKKFEKCKCIILFEYSHFIIYIYSTTKETRKFITLKLIKNKICWV